MDISSKAVQRTLEYFEDIDMHIDLAVGVRGDYNILLEFAFFYIQLETL
jgi:hypothetical protein